MTYPHGQGRTRDIIIPTLDGGHEHSELENLRTDHGKLERRVGQVEADREEIRRGLAGQEELAGTVGGHGDQLAAAEERIAALTVRLAWLESVVRAAGLVPADDLAPDAETRRLAQAAAAGRAARHGLLAEEQRASKKAAITYLAKVRAERAEAVNVASAAATALGQSPAGSPTHTRAAERYKDARAVVTAAETTLAEHGDADVRHERELAADDAARAKAGPLIARGGTAEVALYARLRTHLVDALRRNAILPEWFTCALGPAAPGGEPSAWFDAALSLLTYRAMFAVADPHQPLGVPSATDDQHQRAMRRSVNDLIKAAGKPG